MAQNSLSAVNQSVKLRSTPPIHFCKKPKMFKALRQMPRGFPRPLFCRCGNLPVVAGVCRRCYARRAHSRRRFAGQREAALHRDGRQCQACGGREAWPVANPS
jgi:hypothetical protein